MKLPPANSPPANLPAGNMAILILCACAALAACHRQSGPAPAAKPAPRTGARVAPKSGPDAQELTSGMVEAVIQGKSQAPVTLKFDLLQRPAEGQPLEVVIALLPRVAASPATVEVVGSDGATLEAGAARFEFPSVEAAQVYRHSIKVTPTAEGLLLLTLSVSLQHDQSTESQAFSLPILVGNATGSLSAAPASAAAHPPGTAAQQSGPGAVRAHEGS